MKTFNCEECGITKRAAVTPRCCGGRYMDKSVKNPHASALGRLGTSKTLTLEDQEAMCLDETLENGERTTRVQVTVSFLDDTGALWHADRIVKMRLRRE